jgi:ribonuclease J
LKAIEDEMKNLKAICISHAHLDHVGAVPFFTNKIKVPIHGTRFTIEVLKALLLEKQTESQKKQEIELIAHEQNERFRVSKNLEIEFIHVTHSTPHTVLVVVHTPEGSVVYANDFKLDNTPVLGEKPNYEAMKKLTNVKALIMDSLYALNPQKTPSEKIAKEMLEEVMMETDSIGSNIIVTTFSSHIERLKTIVEISEKLKRTPVFVGRSISKYLDAAKAAGIIDFEKRAEFVKYGSKVEKYFEKTKKTDDKVFIVTGHQGEPKAVLSRLARQRIFPFKPEDIVIFSCKVIPTEDNYRNREKLENELKAKKARIFTNIHVSGHAAREDHREMIKLIRPENIIPTHGLPEMLQACKELAIEMGYKPEKVHLLKNASSIYV